MRWVWRRWDGLDALDDALAKAKAEEEAAARAAAEEEAARLRAKEVEAAAETVAEASRAWVDTAEVYAAAAASRVSSARSIAEVHEGRAVTPHCHLFCHP